MATMNKKKDLPVQCLSVIFSAYSLLFSPKFFIK